LLACQQIQEVTTIFPKVLHLSTIKSLNQRFDTSFISSLLKNVLFRRGATIQHSTSSTSVCGLALGFPHP